MSALPPLDLRPRRPAWGVRPPARKSLSTAAPLRVLPPPAQVTLALVAGDGPAAVPCVAVGQTVQCGEPVATAGGPGGCCVHASIAGRVVAIGPAAVAGRPGPAPTITIAGDGTDTRHAGYAPCGEPGDLPPAGLTARLAASGIVGLGGALFPAARKLTDCADVHTLLLNGVECEPYISCDDRLLRERADRVVDGARWLLAASGVPRAVIAIKTDMAAARVALADALAAAADPRLALAVVTSLYPAGGERQLIELVLGREVPAGELPRATGVLCHNVATAAAVADFCRRGQPLISRIVTVTGGAISAPCNVEARLGTRTAELVAAAGGYRGTPARLVMGGPMMGVALPDDTLPVTAATNCVLAATAGELPGGSDDAEAPCIRCGDCVEACPARLAPQELLVAARADDPARLAALDLAACIECGACDYVCPSHIALTRRFVAAKARLADAAAARAMADQAAARHAARAARLAATEAERARELAAQLPDPDGGERRP
jgi:electron transport complex protein RnfC